MIFCDVSDIILALLVTIVDGSMDPIKTLSETLLKLEGAYSKATIRAYKADFESFIFFCNDKQINPLPCSPLTAAQFIKYLTERPIKSATIRRAIASISTIHRLNRMPDPTKDPEVVIEMRRMHRTLGRCSRQAYGINSEILKRLIAHTEGSLRGYRDRALLLLAYDTLCRRSELVSLTLEDLVFESTHGNVNSKIKIRRSKTDQEGLGRWLYLSDQTKDALQEWIRAAKLEAGALFRGVDNSEKISESLKSGQINRIYKKLAHKAKLDAKIVSSISGHSLRVGAAQDLLSNGATMPMIMSKGRWSKPDTVMRYLENAII